MLSLLLTVSTATPPDTAAWRPIRTLLDNWQFTTEYAISIGTADHGQLFVYESGNFTMDQQIPTGSTSKWPSAMMFAGLVGDGTIRSLDDPVHEYLPYWTKHPLDARSQITLRHLLTFTSGFGDGHPGFEFNTRAARAWRAGRTPPRNNISRECDLESGDTAKCAQSIYSGVKLIGVPGHVYSYNSNHLQLAAGVAVAASGLPIKEVVRRYLLQPFGLTDSYYEGRCPDFAGSLVTTGRDYERFLQSLLSYRHPSPALILESERDGTPFLSDQYTLYGNYGFGHFLMCFDSAGGFTDACADARSHFDPGAFGFIPVLDRKYGFYLNLVAAETAPTGSYPLSGIPEYLAVGLKPHVEAILSQRPPRAEEHLHHNPAIAGLSLADVNYALGCRLHPDSCA